MADGKNKKTGEILAERAKNVDISLRFQIYYFLTSAVLTFRQIAISQSAHK
jgi:hypothetical protein